ncbi:MAG: hypothetical protein ACOVNY_03965 [Chitinophagaceae bacterium]
MKNYLPCTIFTIAFFLCIKVNAFYSDTIQISPQQIKTNVLIEGTHSYLVYFKMAKDAPRTQAQFWTRTISKTTHNGKDAIEVNQVWEDKDSIMHSVKSVCDAKTFQTFTHDSWWKQRGTTSVDFENKTIAVNNKTITPDDTSRMAKRLLQCFQSAQNEYHLNWHLDLEVFPILPYKQGVTFIIPFYDPGTTATFTKVAYTVTGSAELTGYNQQKIDCWLLSHESKGNKELFWISKKTKEVLKLEQEINGKIYRYKIKLGFSI